MPARGELHYAASQGDAREVTRLLKNGADVNEQDYDKRTALHVAAANGHLSVLEVLCAHDADMLIVDRWDRTALADAMTGNHSDAVAFLKQRSGNGMKGAMFMKQVSFKQINPNSPLNQLFSACVDGSVPKVKELLDSKKVNVNDCDDDRRTAAHLAASEGKLEILKLLAERSANLNAKDRMGNRPLNDAQRGGHDACFNFLASQGAVISSTSLSPSNNTPQDDQKLMTVRHVSKDALAELHNRGIREFWSWSESDFVIEKEPFAHGSGGEVYKCRFRNMEIVAKTLGKLQSRQNLTDLSNEISLMSSIRHPHIVTFFGACFQLAEPVMLMEYCAGGNLESRIIRGYAADSTKRIKISDGQKLKYAHQMALAMTFLHNFHVPIIHRDLKPGNVLLTANDDVRITDFGLAKFTPKDLGEKKENDTYKMTGETGSYRFMAPEVFEHRKYDNSVDVYAYTMIIYWLFCGVRPFVDCKDGRDAARNACKKVRPDLKNLKEEQISEICEFGWSQDPAARPTFAQIADRLEECKISGFSRNRGRSKSGMRSSSFAASKASAAPTSESEPESKTDETVGKPLEKRKSIFQVLFRDAL